jgi:hypothetical protein
VAVGLVAICGGSPSVPGPYMVGTSCAWNGSEGNHMSPSGPRSLSSVCGMVGLSSDQARMGRMGMASEALAVAVV